jgi:hypothetical protein
MNERTKQIRDELLRHFAGLRDYWADKGKDKQDACDGVVFSLLCAIDGCSLEAPPVKLLTGDGEPLNELNEELHAIWPDYAKSNKQARSKRT